MSCVLCACVGVWVCSGLACLPVHVMFTGLPSSSTDALEKNQELEFERNKERFLFLKWGARALENFLIVPPGSGIVHQVAIAT